MNGRKWILALIAVMLFAMVPLQAFAEETNRNDVRARLAEGGWAVVYGDLINEADYAKVAGSIAVGVKTGNPSLIKAAFTEQLQVQFDKIKRTAPDILQADLERLILDAFRTQGQSIRRGRLEVSAGMATYNRWERVVYKEPRTYTCMQKGPFGTKFKSICTTMEAKERRVPYPNNFQPYIRYRWAR